VCVSVCVYEGTAYVCKREQHTGLNARASLRMY